MNLYDLLNKEERKHVKIVLLEKGKTLFKEDDECKNVGIVLKGSISIISFAYTGKEILFNKLKKDDVFGNNLIFSSFPFYKGDVIANEDSEIALINKQHLLNILMSNKEFLLEYLKIQSDFGKELNARIKILAIDKAEDRLMFYLVEHGGLISFTSITSLAKELNLERETLSRLISNLVKRRKIQRNDKTIVLL